MKIGIVGTGVMGKPMAHNLQKAGHQLYIWNRTKAKAESLLQDGAVWCGQPAEVARRAEIVGLVLATHEATKEVFHGPEGLLAGVHPELWVVDHGTNPASWALDAQALVASRKGWYVDAPVMGSRPQAVAASLVVAAGTTKTASEKLVTYLEAIGSQVVWTGEVARGARLKLAVNLYLASTTAALAESLSLATASGLEPQVFLEALNTGALASPYLKLKGAKLASQDYSPQFTLSLMHKDLRLIQAEASSMRTPLFMGGAALALFALAERMGLGEADLVAVREIYQRE